jgi:hypothetical protein
MSEKNDAVEVEETLDLPEETKEGEEDTTDWKAEAQKLQAKAIKQRESTKELKARLKELTPAEKKAEAKSGDLDNGQKALLVAYGVKGPDEIALAKSWMQRTGDDIDVLIGDDIFTAKLNALREAKATQQAIPSGTKRSTNSPKDSVDYHLEKYENGTMPLNEMDFEMRSKVLTAKLEKDKKASKFNFTPSQ